MPVTPRRKLSCVALAMAGLVACADIPDFPEGSAGNAPYPKIIAMSDILSQIPVDQGDHGTGSLAARATALQARAARLRRTNVVDAATRARMQSALARH